MAVLAEVFPSVVTEAEVSGVSRIDLHPTTCASVALCRQVLLEVSMETREFAQSIDSELDNSDIHD